MQTRSQSVEEKKIMKKLVIIGDGGVGKTTYLNKIFTGMFTKRYFATLGVELYPFNDYIIWDTAGQTKFSGLGEDYYIGADYGIIMCSESKITQKSIKDWYNILKRTSPNIKIIMLCNKSELDYQLTSTLTSFLDENNVEIFYISTKNDSVEDLLKPFEMFA
jgi:GTP-binding nuclear protein Ran